MISTKFAKNVGGGIVHMLLPSLADCWHKAFPEDNQPNEEEEKEEEEEEEE